MRKNGKNTLTVNRSPGNMTNNHLLLHLHLSPWPSLSICCLCVSEKPEVMEAQEGQELCVVCGDIANGVHFGQHSCEGCKVRDIPSHFLFIRTFLICIHISSPQNTNVLTPIS
jgi:hypothetical protein